MSTSPKKSKNNKKKKDTPQSETPKPEENKSGPTLEKKKFFVKLNFISVTVTYPKTNS